MTRITQDTFEESAKSHLERINIDRGLSRNNKRLMRIYDVFSAVAKEDGVDTSTYDREADLIQKRLERHSKY